MGPVERAPYRQLHLVACYGTMQFTKTEEVIDTLQSEEFASKDFAKSSTSFGTTPWKVMQTSEFSRITKAANDKILLTCESYSN